jgi:hypothetical protein
MDYVPKFERFGSFHKRQKEILLKGHKTFGSPFNLLVNIIKT